MINGVSTPPVPMTNTPPMRAPSSGGPDSGKAKSGGESKASPAYSLNVGSKPGGISSSIDVDSLDEDGILALARDTGSQLGASTQSLTSERGRDEIRNLFQ